MSVLKFLAADGFLTVNKHLAKIVGLDAAVLMAELASTYNYYESTDQLTDDGMFFETVERIEENTTLTKYQQAKAVTVLTDAGVLETRKIGIPAKRYFKIDEDALFALVDHKKSKNFTTGGQKTEPQEVEKLDRNNNIDKKEKKKENNNKSATAAERVYQKWSVAELVYQYRLSDSVRQKMLEFFEYRKEIKKPLKSERSIRSLLKQVEMQEQAHGAFAVIDVIDRSIQNGWQGLFFDRIQQGKQQQNRRAEELDSFYRMANDWAHEQNT